MKCHVCGSKMKSIIADLPFKVNETTIVILKALPVLQCDSCSEYLYRVRIWLRNCNRLKSQASH